MRWQLQRIRKRATSLSLRTSRATDLKGIAGACAPFGGAAPGFCGKPFRCFSRPAASLSLSDAKRKLNSFCAAGQKRRPAKVRWCDRSGERRSPIAVAAALMQRLDNEPHRRLRYFCSPAYRQRALSDHQPDGADCGVHAQRQHASETRQARCISWRRASRRLRTGHCLLICSRCQLDGRFPTFALDPPQRRQKTLEALTAQLEALAQAKSVLMIFEDVHWIDPTSLEAQWIG